MKKRILTIFTLILIFVSSCSHNAVNAIDEFNENMNLPFPLALAAEDLEYGDEYEEQEYFGQYLIKEGLSILISGWPDVLDSRHVTDYTFTDDEYNIFGFSVGDTFDNATSILKKHGYKRNKKEETDIGNQGYIFAKNKQVRIMLIVDKDKNISEISVSAITTNKDNVVF